MTLTMTMTLVLTMTLTLTMTIMSTIVFDSWSFQYTKYQIWHHSGSACVSLDVFLAECGMWSITTYFIEYIYQKFNFLSELRLPI